MKTADMLIGRVLMVMALLAFSGCSTLSSWWSDDEPGAELPIVNKAEVSLSSAEQAGGIHVQWQVDLDQRQPASPSGFSIPLVVRTAAGLRIVAGTQDRRLRIYDMAGKELDRIALLEACESGALQLTGGLVVAGDVGGHIYGLDIEKGSVVWQQDMPSVLMSEPVAIGDGFLIQTADNRIYRFNGEGKKLWSYTGPSGGLSMRMTPSPLLARGQLFAAFSNGDVVALRADTGALVWKRQLLLDNRAAVLSELRVPTATPVLIPAAQSGRDEDMLAVSLFQGDLVFLSLLDGSRLVDRNISLKTSPLLLNKHLFVADGTGAVSALDAGHSETLWKQQLTHGELTGPALYRGALWVADDMGKVYRLSPEGKVLADVQLPGRIDRAPVASEAGVLVRNSLGTLFLLN
ncbi:MAG: PQQ-binding-like beta-propeller repeat protein [Mariprofundaceae bacterium]